MRSDEYVEQVKERYHYDKVTKIMETLLWIMGITLIVSLVFVINLHSDNLLWNILILVCGVGIIFTLVLEWAYIGIVLNVF